MKKKTIFGAAGLAAAGVVAGCVMSVAGVANASDVTSASSSVSAGSASVATATPPTFGGANGSGPVGSGPDGNAPDFKGGPNGGTPVTGDLKATLSDLATAKVAGSTVDDVIKHADGTYDVHVTKADGTTHASVEFDANQNITDVHDMTPPAGGNGPGRGFGQGPDGNDGSNDGTPVTGDLKATLSDLATAKVAGSTVDDVIKHADGTYDVHVTKADGTTHASIEFDANQNITDVHDMTPPADISGPAN